VVLDVILLRAPPVRHEQDVQRRGRVGTRRKRSDERPEKDDHGDGADATGLRHDLVQHGWLLSLAFFNMVPMISLPDVARA
jgi:hypothetical protein